MRVRDFKGFASGKSALPGRFVRRCKAGAAQDAETTGMAIREMRVKLWLLIVSAAGALWLSSVATFGLAQPPGYPPYPQTPPVGPPQANPNSAHRGSTCHVSSASAIAT